MLQKVLILILILSAVDTFGQTKATKKAQPIVMEGKLLYRLEMTSWYGTDLFLEQFKDRDLVGGYFSYIEKDVSKCIFFSNSSDSRVIGTITFDHTLNTQTATTDLTERAFSQYESDLYVIRHEALEATYQDTMFKTYKNTNLNFIPVISGKEKKVYILTGPQNSGVVIFGNDYLLRFNKHNKLIEKKQLHKNILPQYYDDSNNESVGGIHTHLPETGEFMTATDICTLMLYAKFANWKSYHVVSKKYMNIWNCTTNELIVIPMETVGKLEKGQQKKE